MRAEFFRGSTGVWVLVAFLAMAMNLGAQSDSGAGAGRELVRPARLKLRHLNDPPVAAAIENGLKFLKDKQHPGSGAIGNRYPVAVTALGGLAILGAGYNYRDSEYGVTLRDSVSYLLRASESGSDGYLFDKESKMHGHCYAILFLTQLYGELPSLEEGRARERVRRAIERGLKVIRKSQTVRGGWYYSPRNLDRKDEASLTICALQALRAGREIGFNVPSTTINRAVKYVKDCQVEEDGSFRYSLSARETRTSYALTVAAVSTLQAAGQYDDDHVRRGLEYAGTRLQKYSADPFKAADGDFFFYANLYAAQAFYQAGGEIWSTWYPSARQYLLQKQKSNGRWEDQHGAEYGTACALLILQVSFNYLPIFER